MPSFMCSKAASLGACCRVNLLPGRPCTFTFVFGGLPGSGTGFMINSGIRYGLAKADYLSKRSNCGQPKRANAAKGGDRGYYAAKRTKGRKRHIVVDVLGLILAGANVQDRDGGQLVLKGLKDRFPRLARVWADGVYAGRLVDWAEKTAQFVLDIVFKPTGQIAFSVLPWRWIVERTFAWLGKSAVPRGIERCFGTLEPLLPRGRDCARRRHKVGVKLIVLVSGAGTRQAV